MLPIEPLGLKASQWEFLSNPHKYAEASGVAGRRLVLESIGRQFSTARDILERLNGSYGEPARRGILLADDVGLGKTTVAALVAWIVASAGEKRNVRVLAPNDVMVRRWEEELRAHVEPLQRCARFLKVTGHRVKTRRVDRLSAGSIQVAKHSYASQGNLSCDLLIIDEAHRAKGEGTHFSEALKKQVKNARRVLILSATPFSIDLKELQRMLTLIGADAARGPIGHYSRALDKLYSGNAARSVAEVAKRLADKARAAVEALRPWVIRHGIDDLPLERAAFGSREDWPIDVPVASADELEIMVRMDRALRLAKDAGADIRGATNDARFHVGWRHLDEERERLKEATTRLPEPVKTVLQSHLHAIQRLRRKTSVHSKMASVGAAVKRVVEREEKVLLFCHHIATAQELTTHLARVLLKESARECPPVSAWRKAWGAIIERHEEEPNLRTTFIDWLSSEPIRRQTWRRLASAKPNQLVSALTKTRPPHSPVGHDTFARAAQSLFRSLVQSRSSSRVLAMAGEERLDLIPGQAQVLGVCDPSDDPGESHLFIHNRQPDTVIAVFNSPFGPDVLVVTDKLSEGIDLHRACRHLVHYELDPSPIRTVQRNGRLRRVNCWAAVTGRPIQYAFPAFRGTRDHRLVQIMKKRVDSFSLLLGGAQDFEIDDVNDADEQWRNEVIARAKAELSKAGGELRTIAPRASHNPGRASAPTARPRLHKTG